MALPLLQCGQYEPDSSTTNCWRLKADSQVIVPENVTTAVSSSLMKFAYLYANVHGYISICVCAFGIVTNFFNVTVLTRRNMRTPTNYILSWLAVSDIITMMSYVPFAVHFYCFYPPGQISVEKNNLFWMTVMLVHVNLSATTHTTSIWLCVALAIFRYLHIRNPTKGQATRLRRLAQTKLIVLIIYAASVLVLIPNYMSNVLERIYVNANQTDQVVYVFKDTELGSGETDAMYLVNAWLYSVIAKIIPCILMSIFGALLIYHIQFKNRRRRERLVISGASSLRLTEHSRTTKMLLAVIVLFLITEFPQGVLVILSAVIPHFFETIYLPLGDAMDIVALINNSVNFVLYCTMSAQFRQTFLKLYCSFPKKDQAVAVHMPLQQKPDSNSPNSPQS
ncbi:G-protein coupled receptor dmsr-1-like [Liolophura sinensis]|uniref:G-protein coupled receptor dmsr-1-like n=1 Tax=Liolophura sinensis TaxID=3198878 RepID=UPI00315824A2